MLSSSLTHASAPNLQNMDKHAAHSTAVPAADAGGAHQLELERLMREAPSRRNRPQQHPSASQLASSSGEEAEITPPTTDDEMRYDSKKLPCSPPAAKRALSQPVIGSSTDEEVMLKIFCMVRAASHPNPHTPK